MEQSAVLYASVRDTGVYALRTERVDPAALPAAGVRCKHDSANEDYRWKLAHVNPDGISHRRLQKADTLRTQSTQFPSSKLELPAVPSTSNKPDHHFINDIEFSGPAPRPGLTLIQPLAQPSSTGRHAAHGDSSDLLSPSRGTLSSRPHPARETNPLAPCYPWPEPQPGSPRSGAGIRVYPTAAAAQEPGEWRYSSPVRRGALDTSDIRGSAPTPSARQRRDEYSSFDYRDVTQQPLSPVKQRLLRDGHAGAVAAAASTARLGIWAGSLGGDSGNFMHTSRQPTNPNKPAYQINGQLVTDGKDVGQPRSLIAPAAADPLRRTWHDTGDRSLLDSMQSLGDKRSWHRSSSFHGPAARHGTGAGSQRERAAAVAEVAALL